MKIVRLGVASPDPTVEKILTASRQPQSRVTIVRSKAAQSAQPPSALHHSHSHSRASSTEAFDGDNPPGDPLETNRVIVSGSTTATLTVKGRSFGGGKSNMANGGSLKKPAFVPAPAVKRAGGSLPGGRKSQPAAKKRKMDNVARSTLAAPLANLLEPQVYEILMYRKSS
jgi:hypothetical protein